MSDIVPRPETPVIPAPAVGKWMMIQEADAEMRAKGFSNGLIVKVLKVESAADTPSYNEPETYGNTFIRIGRKIPVEKPTRTLVTPKSGKLVNHRFLSQTRGGSPGTEAFQLDDVTYLLTKFEWNLGHTKLEIPKNATVIVTGGPWSKSGVDIGGRIKFTPGETFYRVKYVEKEMGVDIDRYPLRIPTSRMKEGTFKEPDDPMA